MLFDRVTDEINTHKVIVDNYKGAYDATEHLIQNGYKRIAVITGSEFLSITSERMAGYQEALKAYDLPIRSEYIKPCFYGGMDFSEVEDAVNKLFTLKERPDAIFTTADKLTIGCLRTLKRRGISIPGDIGLVGFTNTDIAELLDPPLTLLRQPAEEMGRAATELLLQLIESKRPIREFEKRVMSPEMQIRASSFKF